MAGSTPSTAGAKLWAIFSLRQEVFSYLEKPCLVRCLTLEKRSFGEAVKALYAEMEHVTVSRILSEEMKHARSDIYRSSIRRINIRWHRNEIGGFGLIKPTQDIQQVIKNFISSFSNLTFIGRSGQESPVIILHRNQGEIRSSTVLCNAVVPYSFDLSKMEVIPEVQVTDEGRKVPKKTVYNLRISGRRDNPWPSRIWEAWADHEKPFDGEIGGMVVARLSTPPISDLISFFERRRLGSNMRLLRLDLGEQPGMTCSDLTALLRAADGKVKEIYLEDSTETVAFGWIDTLRAIAVAKVRKITYLRLPVKLCKSSVPTGPQPHDTDELVWTDDPYPYALETLHLKFPHFSDSLKEANIDIPLLAQSLLAVGGPLCEYEITHPGYVSDEAKLETKVRKAVGLVIQLERAARERGWSKQRGGLIHGDSGVKGWLEGY